MRVLITIIACSLITLPALADGRKIKVPKDYPNIQTAINFAEDGDTVIVDDGVWTGPNNKNLDFLGLAITVRSKNGPDNCIIDCEGEGRGFWFHENETEASVLNGFSITNGNEDDGGGIYCSGSSPTITNCTITDNTACCDRGGGIYCDDSHPTITNCTIAGNTASNHGGGINCYSSDPRITNCTITGNKARRGGGISCWNGNPTISNCTIAGNTASNHGGGIYCDDSHPTITNCTIADNTAYYGGGGIGSSNGDPTITNCTITGNTAHCDGGGIRCFSNNPTITNCTITENTASEYGGGICCSGSSPTITNCTITENTASDRGGGIFCYDSDPTITNCILWSNTPHEIYVHSSNPKVNFSDVQGNWPGLGNIDADPLWVSGPLGDFYLSQQQCGQPEDSPCLDAGKSRANKLGLRKYTTCIEGKKDKKRVDMGYHYPRR